MLTKDEIVKYFAMINNELEKLNLTGEIIMTDGASMCLVYEQKYTVDNIDTIFTQPDIIEDIARNIAVEKNIPLTWLKDCVSVFFAEDPSVEVFINLSSLTQFTT
jgi:hypothetical protein